MKKRLMILIALCAMAMLTAYAGPKVGQTDGQSVTLAVVHDTTGRAVSSLTALELRFIASVPQAQSLNIAVQEMVLASVVHIPACDRHQLALGQPDPNCPNCGKYHIGDAKRYWEIYQAWTGPAKVTVPLIAGPAGATGATGATGPQGADGGPGPQGPQGISVVNSFVNAQGHLIVILSNNATIDTGYVIGPQGATGATGAQGAQGPRGFKGDPGEIRTVYFWSYAGQQQPLTAIAAAPSNYGYFSVPGSGGFAGLSYNGGTNITAYGGEGGKGGHGGNVGDIDIENNNSNSNANTNVNNTGIAIDGKVDANASGGSDSNATSGGKK